MARLDDRKMFGGICNLKLVKDIPGSFRPRENTVQQKQKDLDEKAKERNGERKRFPRKMQPAFMHPIAAT